MATSIIMGSKTVENEKLQRSITNVSPQATDTQLVNFAEGLNNLSTNTLYEINRVETTELMGDTRLDRNIHFTDTTTQQTVATTISFSSIQTMDNPQKATAYYITFEGSSEAIIPTLTRTGDSTNTGFVAIDWYYDGGWVIALLRDTGTWNGGTITISVPGDTNYKPASITLTITQ